MRLVYFVLAWCAGILLAANAATQQPLAWFIAACLSLAAILLARRAGHRRALHILLLALALGGLRFSLAAHSADLAHHNGRSVTVEGIVVDSPRLRGDEWLLRVAVDRVEYAGRVFETTGGTLIETPHHVAVAHGDRIRARGDLFQPPRFDTFSYADYLARAGLFSLMPHAAVEVIDGRQSNSFMTLLAEWRSAARDQIAAALPEPHAGLLSGILLGDESGIAPDIEDAFARTGAAHVIAISGFNMVIVSTIVTRLLLAANMDRRHAALIAIAVISLYTLFVGAGAGVVRAAVMSSLVLIGDSLIRRKTFLPASLALAALLMSLRTPTVLWDIGFQLSLFATLSIMLFTDPLTRTLERTLSGWIPTTHAQRITAALGPTLIVSMAAQILVLPLIALYFERISLVSLLTNLLILPVQPAILVLGALAAAAAFVLPPAAVMLFWAVLAPLAWTTQVVRILADLPFADMQAQFRPELVAVAFLAVVGVTIMHVNRSELLAAAVRFLRRTAVQSFIIGAALLLLFMTGTVLASRPDGRLHLWLLDMGHSHAVMVQTPDGAQILVDGGRFPSRLLLALGDRMPFYDRELDMIILTQPDEFDTGALIDVLRRYDAGIVLTNGQPILSPAQTALETALGGTSVLPVTAGHSVTFSDGVRMQVLNPLITPTLEDSLDDSALVLRLTFDRTSILITSDVSAEAQRTLVEDGLVDHATALILPQHGTAGALAAEFLTAVQPQIVLLQSDAANRRGDPHPDTLTMLDAIPLFRTDQGGTIHLSTDGRTIDVSAQN